jgi:hypothetical protein
MKKSTTPAVLNGGRYVPPAEMQKRIRVLPLSSCEALRSTGPDGCKPQHSKQGEPRSHCIGAAPIGAAPIGAAPIGATPPRAAFTPRTMP